MAHSESDSLKPTLTAGCESIFDYCCGLCNTLGYFVEATVYCSDCRYYLCSECFNVHLRHKPMHDHILLDQHQLPKDKRKEKGGDTCAEACTDHPHKAVEYFCTQHDELGCTVCMALNHSKCEGVGHISEVASDVLNDKDYINLQEEVTSLTQVATTAIQASQDQVKRSKHYHTIASGDFEQFKKYISTAVDIIEQNLTKEADIIKREDEKKMTAYENKYNDVLKDIQALSSKFTSLQNNGQFCKLFIATKRARREIDEIKARIGRPEHGIKARHCRLITSSEVQILQDTLEAMVKLEVVNECQQGSNTIQTATLERQTHQNHKKTTRESISSPKRKATAVIRRIATFPFSRHKTPAALGHATLQHNREARKTRAQHVIDIQVKSMEDRVQNITGSVVLPGDKLVVVDYHNDKVKLVDLTNKIVVSQLNLPVALWAITNVDGRQVAVTSTNTNTIYVVNVSDKLELDRKIKVKGQCRGIACIKGKLLVSYDDPVKVEIINMKGQLLQTVVTEDRGRELFISPWHVAVSKDWETFYISDYNIQTITSIDVTGQVQAKYKDEKLAEPRGLTVDSAGRVYACGVASNNILQLTGDLTEVQELLKESDGIVYPESIYYCEDTENLYIGMSGDALKVFHLK